MPRKYEARDDYWNWFFEKDLQEFCEKREIRLTKKVIDFLWSVALKQPNLSAECREQFFDRDKHVQFVMIYLQRPDEVLAVMTEMRRLDAKLGKATWGSRKGRGVAAKRILLFEGSRGRSDDEIRAAHPELELEDIAEARKWISRRQATRKTFKSSE